MQEKRENLDLIKRCPFSLSLFFFFKATYLSVLCLATQREDGSNGKMRRGKWPDLGLNPFPFHFSFINNPPNNTIHSQPHTLDPTSTSLIAASLPLSLPAQSSASGTCWREKAKAEHPHAALLFSCGGKQREGKTEKEMER